MRLNCYRHTGKKKQRKNKTIHCKVCNVFFSNKENGLMSYLFIQKGGVMFYLFIHFLNDQRLEMV